MATDLTSKKLEALPPEELARIESRGDKNSTQDILIREEWKRRMLLKQHALNESIIKTQQEQNNKTLYICALIGFVGVVVGAFITAWLVPSQQQQQKETQQEAKASPSSESEKLKGQD